MIEAEPLINSTAMPAATIRSGQGVPVSATAPAARMTATLPMASFLEQSQTERTLASPSRNLNSTSALATLAANASAPTIPMVAASGWPSTTTR